MGEARRRSLAVLALLGGTLALIVPLAIASRGRGRTAPGTPRPSAQQPPERPGPSASAADWVRWGDHELLQSKLRAAEQAFVRARQIDPALPTARLRLAWVHTLRMRRAEALAEFGALAGLAPRDFDQVLLWTQVRCALWDPERTIPQLRRLLDAGPGDRGVRLALAEGLRRLGQRAEADEVLSPLDADDNDARVIRARLAIDRGEPSAAEAILADGPSDHADLADLRGQLALTRRDWPAAIAAFRQAVAIQPDHHGGLSGLARALRLAGQDKEADPLAEAVQRSNTLINLVRGAGEGTGRRDPKLLRALGEACEALRFEPEARAWYDLALSRDPTDRDVQLALYRLRPANAARRP